MREPRLSVLIVAKNEAHNLADCLRAASWADERVVVVDPASRDATREIAEKMADVVIVRAFDDFASQRNTALAAASGDWVLSIDADERATPALAEEVRRVIGEPGNSKRGYRVPIRSVILGRPFGYSGTQHDLPLRLFRRDSGRWVGLVHETVELEGACGTLQSALGHHTLPNVQAFLGKLDHYTTLEARRAIEERRQFRTSDVTLRPVWTFLKLYLFKQGFRDGVEGFLFCALSGVSVAVRAWKVRELMAQGRAS
jgi:glycosyltransferase involved in cell wall biosynthesis